MNEIRTIPFSQLTLSPSNARKAASNPSKNKELQAAIKAQGILQNLVVKPNGDPDRFEVTAGGRRYKTLAALIEDNEEGFDFNYPVPCLVIERSDIADEASLSENICREDMDLIDQYMAYQKLHALHNLSVKDLAKHFGKSQQDVRKALKLGKVHPELIELYRNRKLDIDDLMAFTLEEDPDKQLQVYESLKSNGQYVNVHTIRRRITSSNTDSKDRRVKFIGLKEYKKSGGATANDIFNNTTYVLDEPLLDKLVKEKLEDVCTELQTEWLWADIRLDFEPWHIWDCEVLKGESSAPEDLKQQLADLQAKSETIDEALDEGAELSDLDPDLRAIASTIEEDIEYLENTIERCVEHTPDQKRKSGCIVTLDDKGELAIYKGILENSETESDSSEDPDSNNSTSSKKSKKPEQKKFSQALQDDLARYKHMVGQWSLVLGDNNPDNTYALGYDLVLFQLCYEALLPIGKSFSGALDIRTRQTSEETTIKDRNSYKFYKELKNLRSDMDLSWLDQDPVHAFAEFRNLDSGTKQMLVAYVAALTLKRELYGDKNSWLDFVLDHQMKHFADHWRPTKENFYSRATKPFLLEAGNSMFDQEWGKRNGNEKKALLAEQLHDRTQELDSPAVWLPDGMEPQLD